MSSVHVGRIERATERREARKTPLLAESHRMQQRARLLKSRITPRNQVKRQNAIADLAGEFYQRHWNEMYFSTNKILDGPAAALRTVPYFDWHYGGPNEIRACVCDSYPRGHLVLCFDTKHARSVQIECLETNVAYLMNVFCHTAPRIADGVVPSRRIRSRAIVDHARAFSRRRKIAFSEDEKELESQVVVFRDQKTGTLQSIDLDEWNQQYRSDSLKRQRALERKRCFRNASLVRIAPQTGVETAAMPKNMLTDSQRKKMQSRRRRRTMAQFRRQ